MRGAGSSRNSIASSRPTAPSARTPRWAKGAHYSPHAHPILTATPCRTLAPRNSNSLAPRSLSPHHTFCTPHPARARAFSMHTSPRTVRSFYLALPSSQHVLSKAAAKLFVNSFRRTRHLDLTRYFSIWRALLLHDEGDDLWDYYSSSSVSPNQASPPMHLTPTSARRGGGRRGTVIGGVPSSRPGVPSPPPLPWHQAIQANVLQTIERIKSGSLPGIDYPAHGGA